MLNRIETNLQKLKNEKRILEFDMLRKDILSNKNNLNREEIHNRFKDFFKQSKIILKQIEKGEY